MFCLEAGLFLESNAFLQTCQWHRPTDAGENPVAASCDGPPKSFRGCRKQWAPAQMLLR